MAVKMWQGGWARNDIESIHLPMSISHSYRRPGSLSDLMDGWQSNSDLGQGALYFKMCDVNVFLLMYAQLQIVLVWGFLHHLRTSSDLYWLWIIVFNMKMWHFAQLCNCLFWCYCTGVRQSGSFQLQVPPQRFPSEMDMEVETNTICMFVWGQEWK